MLANIRTCRSKLVWQLSFAISLQAQIGSINNQSLSPVRLEKLLTRANPGRAKCFTQHLLLFLLAGSLSVNPSNIFYFSMTFSRLVYPHTCPSQHEPLKNHRQALQHNRRWKWLQHQEKILPKLWFGAPHGYNSWNPLQVQPGGRKWISWSDNMAWRRSAWGPREPFLLLEHVSSSE